MTDTTKKSITIIKKTQNTTNNTLVKEKNKVQEKTLVKPIVKTLDLPKVNPQVKHKSKTLGQPQVNPQVNPQVKTQSTTSYQLIIDCNEKTNYKNGEETYRPIIIKRFHEKKGIYNSKGLEVLTKSLDVGDIWFQIDNQPIIVIERKTLDDLHASIGDGRYHEQKIRIKNSNIPLKYYLVEGDLVNKPITPYFTEGDRNKLYSAIIHTTIRDGIPMLRSQNREDTIRILEKILESIIKQKSQILAHIKTLGPIDTNNDSLTDYSRTIKISKKDNFTPEVCYILQLRQIPGLSQNIAEELVKLYSTMKSLIQAYQTLEDDQKAKDKLLENIPIPISNGKTQRLGPALSKRIAEYLG